MFLEDIDKDGLPDKSTVFAEGLTLPTGIMRWKKGVIITDSPDVIYLEDTDDDRKADKKEIQLTGFSLSNPQHNMNSPMYGLDGWIYLGHEGASSVRSSATSILILPSSRTISSESDKDNLNSSLLADLITDGSKRSS